MIISFIRTIILYFAVVFSLRFMGKRQIGELQPFELVVTIMISDLATIPMQESGIPLLNGLVPIATLTVIEVALSYVNLKSKRIRGFLIGRPTFIIRNGQLDEKALKDLRVNLDDIMDELRKKDIMSINDVEIAIVETDGSISAFPKAPQRPLTPSDLNIQVENDEMPYTIISDGKTIPQNMEKCGITDKKLQNLLKSQKADVQDILVATYTQKDGLLYQLKEKKK